MVPGSPHSEAFLHSEAAPGMFTRLIPEPSSTAENTDPPQLCTGVSREDPTLFWGLLDQATNAQ